MSGGDVPCINVRELSGPSHAQTDRKLDYALGLTSGMTTKCERCGAATEPDTDGMGGSIETCIRCGYGKRISRYVAAAIGPPPLPRLAPPPAAPVHPQPARHHLPPEASMAKIYDKKCLRSGRPFKGNGPAATYCLTCDGCKAASASPPPSAKPAKPVAEKRKPANTGYKAEPPTGGADNMYQPTIDALREEFDGLDARRKKLADAIAHLEGLGAA